GVPDVSKGGSSESEYESWGDSSDEANVQDDEDVQDKETKDEFVHTPTNYVPTDDETNDESNDVTEEEYERINEERYGDVNVSQTNVEPAHKEKDDEEMTVAGHVNVNQEGAATTSTTAIPDSETLAALQLRVNDLEKDVKDLKDVDNSTKVISTIKSKIPNAIKDYLGSNLDDALHKVIERNFADIIKEHSVLVEIVERLMKQYAP
ncbi:hypothetical protein Tco_1470752, partial [Tanacetum coccineum]